MDRKKETINITRRAWNIGRKKEAEARGRKVDHDSFDLLFAGHQAHLIEIVTEALSPYVIYRRGRK